MKKKEPEFSQLIEGMLNIFGLKIDLSKLFSAEDVAGQLEELRERLKKAGGREVLSDEEWRRGESSISGYLRTRGVLGEKEYHIGVAGRPKKGEVVEPPVDVFYEEKEVVVIAEVPGVELRDLKLEAKDKLLSISTHPGAPRSYHKEIKLDFPVEGERLEATCRNGILEVRLPKKV